MNINKLCQQALSSRIILFVVLLNIYVRCSNNINTSYYMLPCLVLLLLIIAMIARQYQQTYTLLSAENIILVSFAITYPVSALVHLIDIKREQERGFYDLIVTNAQINNYYIYYSLVLTFIALMALWYNMKPYNNPITIRTPTLILNTKVLIIFGIIFSLLGCFGTFMLTREASSLHDALLTVNREREIGGGLARYYFMSRWLSWGLTFFVIGFFTTRFAKIRILSTLIVLCSIGLIILNIFSSGGRTEAILALLPLLFVAQRIHPSYTKILGSLVVIVLIVYIEIVTILRTKLVDTQGMSNIIDILDWHAGRFSMIGLGLEMVENKGFAFGSTLFSGLVDAINAPFVLLKIPQLINPPQSITSIIGDYLRGDPDSTGIVPGTICELYYNLGLVGVFIGYAMIGRLARVTIKVMRETNTFSKYCLAVYIVLLICTAVIPGTATSWTYMFLIGGLPALCLYFIEYFVVKHV